MKHMTQQRKEEEKDQKIGEYKEYYAEFLQRKKPETKPSQHWVR